MKTLGVLLLLSSPVLANESIVVTTAASVPIVNSYCEANGIRWAEHGGMCHADPAERDPVICAARDGTGGIYMGSSVMCSIPAGWEDVLGGTRINSAQHPH